MQIDPTLCDPRRIYTLMSSIVVPRPIAWVSTVSTDGKTNLAPFSYFNAVASKPPLISISVGRRRGRRKDTAENASTTGELVVNVVTEANLHAMVQTSGDYPPEVDELARAGLTPLASTLVKPPRVAESPIQMECRTRQIFEVSPGIVDLVIAEVVMFHIADELSIDDDLHVAAPSIRPVARLGGSQYALLGDILEVPRPKV
jgi:flavin reductase (DIM6/NTAB) family NADH-FMN oxidoreductase RutF